MRSCDGGGAAAAIAAVQRAATKRIAINLMERTESLSKKRRAFSIVTQLDDMNMKRRGLGPLPDSDLELDLLQSAFGRHDVVIEAQLRRIHPECQPEQLRQMKDRNADVFL